MKPTVILICALTNGKIAFDYFYNLHKKEKINLLKVYTYKDNIAPNKNMLFPLDDIVPSILLTKVEHINYNKKEIIEINPDFIFVVGWSQLINKEIVNASKNGTIGFHSAKLPKDRGRSTIAWQIAEGYTETALTMFYLSEGIDDGDIIAQEIIKIKQNDYVKDIIYKMNKSTINILKAYFPLLIKGKAPRIKQDEKQANYRRLRNSVEDCSIDWNQNTKDIYNHIRAVSYPYPKAWTLYKGKEIRINKANIMDYVFEGFYCFENPGTILGNIKGYGYLIKTKNGVIAINDFDKKDIFLSTGEILGE